MLEIFKIGMNNCPKCSKKIRIKKTNVLNKEGYQKITCPFCHNETGLIETDLKVTVVTGEEEDCPLCGSPLKMSANYETDSHYWKCANPYCRFTKSCSIDLKVDYMKEFYDSL